MLEVSNLSFSFPHKDLYDDVSFTLTPGQSCAFIGRSGCGKTTLASMLLDTEKYIYDGKITFDGVYTMGYVSQLHDVEPGCTLSVFDYIAADFLVLQNRIADLCAQMEGDCDLDVVLAQYQDALDHFDAIDGDHFEANITRKLNLAGLNHQRDLEVVKLSGGEFKLVQVIKQMLTTPHFIIMDEPDSFLDFENLKALKDLLNDHKGTTLTITHSRYLLNHCFNKILHLENKKIQEFNGNYIAYQFHLLAYKIDLQEKATACQEEIDRNAALVEQRRALATEVDSAAYGRALKARVSLQKRLEAQRIQGPFINIDRPAIALQRVDEPLEGDVLTVSDLSISFDRPLLQDVSFAIGAGEKVAIIGANGAGKTTLMRAIAKAEGNSAITLASEVTLSYLAQNQEETALGEDTIFDVCFDAGFQSYDEITQTLDTFGFPAEKMTAKARTLSGGEKTILALAKLSRANANFLLLDEPTSHLDTYAQLALEDAVKEYNGAVLMISHDFYAIVNTMDYVLLIENNTLRKVRMRTFRKMIYADHFSKDYLELEQSKLQLEGKIEHCLHKNDFTTARELLVELDAIVQAMS